MMKRLLFLLIFCLPPRPASLEAAGAGNEPPRLTVPLTSFNGGQVSPYLEARVDFPKYSSSCRTLENMLVNPLGPVVRRPGTYYIAEANEPVSRLLKFEYAISDVYVIEAGDHYFRFYRNGGQILDPNDANLPYELDTPFEQDEIWDLRYAQADNRMYIVDGNDPPQVLTRASATHTNWSIADQDYIKGPFLPENPPSTYGPDLATDSAKVSVVSTVGGNKNYLVDNSLTSGSYWSTTIVPPTWIIKYDFGAGITKTIEKYTLASGDDNEEYMPKAWIFQGSNNDADWTNLDTRTVQTAWGIMERRSYTFINTTAYRYYRWYLTEHNTPNSEQIYEIEMMEDDDEAINITPSDVQGDITLTASANLFDADQVGALWKLIHQPAGGVEYEGIVEITAWNSATDVNATVIEPLGDTVATERWCEGAWSDYRGWPKTVCFHQQRICYGGSESYPAMLWFSAVGDYNDFEAGADDDDAFSVSLQGQNPIQWLISQDYLLIGTAKSIGRYGEQGQSVTPTTPTYQEQTPHGSAPIQAVMTTDTALYIERGLRKVREFSYNLQYDRYISPDLTILSEEITDPCIVDIAFQLRPQPILWCVLGDGEMATLTYQRDQSVAGWGRQITNGMYMSIITIPGPVGEDEVWTLVHRTIDSNDVYYIEQFQPQNWGDDPNDCFFVDSGLSYSGSATDTFEGLDHLIGETVQVYADAIILADVDVNDGGGVIIETESSRVTIGLPYTSKMETMPLFVGLEDQASNKKISAIYVDFIKTGYCKYGLGANSDLTTINFADPASLTTYYDLYTSTVTYKKFVFPYGSNRKMTIFFENGEPMPLGIRAIIPELTITR